MKNIIEIDPVELQQEKEVVTAVSKWEQSFLKREIEISRITDEGERASAEQQLLVERDIADILPSLNTEFKSVQELTGKEAKELVIKKYKERLLNQPQRDLFIDKKLEIAESVCEGVAWEFARQIIEIPRTVSQQSDETRSGFHDFDLDARMLNYLPVSEEILVRRLREQEDGISYIMGKGRIIPDRLDNIIVNELIHQPEIDYDSQAELLFKLAGQAIARFREYLKYEDDVTNVVQYNKREIARFIYAQMMEFFYCELPEYEDETVYPFVGLIEPNFSKYSSDSLYLYTDTIEPTSSIPGKVFIGFKKSCHDKYKFDSKTEKDFAIILEKDDSVLKWLRPAEGQFRIYWAHNSKKYNPDFIVETTDTIYMAETKMQKEMDSSEVREKTIAAMDYCGKATRFNMKHGKKPWKYILISHEAVQFNMSFNRLAVQYTVSDIK